MELQDLQLNKQHDVSQSIIDSYKTNIASKEEQIVQAESRAVELEKENRAKFEEFECEIANVQKSYHDAGRELDRLEKLLTEKSAKLKHSEVTLLDLNNVLSEKSREYDSLEQENTMLKSSEETLSEKCRVYDSLKQENISEVNQLKDDIVRSSSLVEKYSTALEQVKVECEKLKSDNQTLDCQIARLNQCNQELSAELKSCQKELEEKSSKILVEDRSKHNDEQESLKNLVASLGRELSESRATVEHLEAEVLEKESSEETLSEKCRLYDSLKQENISEVNQLKDQLKKFERTVERLEAEVLEKAEQVEHFEAEIAEKGERLQSLEAEVLEKAEQVQALDQECEELAADYKQLRDNHRAQGSDMVDQQKPCIYLIC